MTRTVDRDQLLQVRRTGKGRLSYLVASDGEALVNDPALNPQAFTELAAGGKRCAAG